MNKSMAFAAFAIAMIAAAAILAATAATRLTGTGPEIPAPSIADPGSMSAFCVPGERCDDGCPEYDPTCQDFVGGGETTEGCPEYDPTCQDGGDDGGDGGDDGENPPGP